MGNVTIKIALGNISVEVSGPSKYAESKVNELLKKYSTLIDSERPASRQQIKNVSPVKPNQKGLAPTEFIRKVNPRGQNERALVLGYYLEKYIGSESFTSKELLDLNKKAKQLAFTNVSDSLAKLVAQGLVMGAGDKDSKRAYAVTTTGEDQVAEMMKTNSGQR